MAKVASLWRAVKGTVRHPRDHLRVVTGAVLPTVGGVAGVGLMTLASLADANDHVPYLPDTPQRAHVLAVGLALTCAAGVIGAVLAYRRGATGDQLARATAEHREELARVKAAAADEVARLREDLLRARNDVTELARLELADIFQRMQLTSSDRISLIMPSRDETFLCLVARYSITLPYVTVGRAAYPVTEGCLGRAWLHAEGIVSDLPDPELNFDEWQRTLERDWNIPPSTSAGFRMKCRVYLAFAIYPDYGPCRGVIVFESQELTAVSPPDGARLNVDALRTQLKRRERSRLISLLDALDGLRA